MFSLGAPYYLQYTTKTCHHWFLDELCLGNKYEVVSVFSFVLPELKLERVTGNTDPVNND